MDVPPVLHFYSPQTGISLELPVGFETGPIDDHGSQYVARDADDEEVVARVVLGVLAEVESGAEQAAVRTVAEAFAEPGDLISERLAVVDECPTATVVVHLPDDLPGSSARLADTDLVGHFTAVACDGGIRTITALAPWSEQESWTEVYDAMIASCRFI